MSSPISVVCALYQTLRPLTSSGATALTDRPNLKALTKTDAGWEGGNFQRSIR
jgi:hypothetical protein